MPINETKWCRLVIDWMVWINLSSLTWYLTLSSMIVKKDCIICQKVSCPYKCPKCLAFYCSAGCCASHKLSCPAMLAKTPSATETSTEKETTNNEKLAIVSQTEKYSSSEIVILEPDKKENLQKSRVLQSTLRSKRLRDDISCIDSSSDRQSALKAMRAKNPEFDNFVMLLLKNVNAWGALSRRHWTRATTMSQRAT